MGSLWSKLRGESPSTANPNSASRGRRGRSRTKTPPSFRQPVTHKEPNPMLTATSVVNQPASNKKVSNSLTTPHEFIWKYGGNKVILTGTFDNWSQSIAMAKDAVNEDVFTATIDLDPRQTWYFKFVVDGVWRCSLDFCTETDEHDNVNNILYPEPAVSK